MNGFSGKIKILRLIEGAKQAEGLAVIIDVFRAFSLECYLYSMGIKEIRPVGSVESAFETAEKISDCILIGERGGKMCDGFDFGNSPSTVKRDRLKDKTIVHTTSAGTQGIINASNAQQIITGSLVNAKAIAEYIKQTNPEKVSLVCRGHSGKSPAPEDELCAQYIKSLLTGEEITDFSERVDNLRYDGGQHFFDEKQNHIFPQKDFFMCTEYDKFDFIIRVNKDELGFITEKININSKN